MKVGDLVWVSWWIGTRPPEMVRLAVRHYGWGGWSVASPDGNGAHLPVFNDQIVRPVTQEELAKLQLTQLEGL